MDPNEESQPLLPHGTVRILDEFDDNGIILLPQPSSSPDDPLNWSKPRKVLSATIVLFITALTAASSNSFSAAGTELVDDYGLSWDQINVAAGVLFLAIGWGTLLLSSAPWLYGRRVSYLVCVIASIIGNAWFARVDSAGYAIGSQLFVGFSQSVAEATAQLSLSDTTFQHQRGLVLGLYVLATSVGTFLGPLVSGYIADSDLGWTWIAWFFTIVSGATLVVTYFGFEETAFERPAMSNTSSMTEPMRGSVSNSGGPSQLAISDETIQHSTKSYWQRIALITPASNLVGSGFKQYMVRMWNNLKIIWLPAVAYAGIQWGFQDAWLSFYLTAEEDNWTSAPYNYGDAASGLMNLPTLIGSVVGCVYGGAMSDWFVKKIALRNNGIYEAEDRLWMMLLPAIISPVGLIIFGVATYRVWPWQAAYVALGFIGFGWGCAGDLSMAFAMDAYPEIVLEGMVGVSVINNTLACIFTFVCSKWMGENSIAEVFITIGIVSFFIMFPLTLLMIKYGKRLRIWSAPTYERFLTIRDHS
ncbi:MFS general substrate transporter [Myriangium duriaei CBS 260.36]|uniref:MFS general substrate transporter n=1 Tax=Myriangium duriaei CBS 260.36 TaxID=1168546 RepID=A0A9P4ML73_9PEZI|nr:MFS general substrate transporter [Myriangium duriaei CBS 260.36]